MPAGMYKRIRSNEKNPHPITITKDGSHPSSMQARDYVFCSECETRFDAEGENYTLRFAAGKERFRLRDELEAIKPSYANKEWRGYKKSDTPNIKREPLAYFGLSMFWRASVHSWPLEDGTRRSARLNLGKENNEALRKYLLGESPVPPKLSIFFVVLTDRLSQGSFYMPTFSHKKDFVWTYVFFACGMLYNLSIGKRLRPGASAICLLGSKDQWIWMRDGEEKTLEAFNSLIAKQPPELRLKEV
jgi:hypothetical protein